MNFIDRYAIKRFNAYVDNIGDIEQYNRIDRIKLSLDSMPIFSLFWIKINIKRYIKEGLIK